VGGTGPYKLVDFKPGDVALYDINAHYHVPNCPFFDTVELKGGGDATAAARAAIQNGAFDFAWDTVVDKDVRERMAQQGRKGTFRIAPSTKLYSIQLNRTDPRTEVDGERSSLKVPHPFFTGLRVRQAFAAAVDRRTIAGDGSTSNVLDVPKQFQSPHTRWEFNLDKAAQLLEQAGWKRGGDGVRVKGSRRMQVVYQSITHLLTQKLQESYATLEQRVEERTTQLAQAHTESSVLNQRLTTDNLRMRAELDFVDQPVAAFSNLKLYFLRPSGKVVPGEFFAKVVEARLEETSTVVIRFTLIPETARMFLDTAWG
jgi:ABC-type transport system substrate-binding protein